MYPSFSIKSCSTIWSSKGRCLKMGEIRSGLLMKYYYCGENYLAEVISVYGDRVKVLLRQAEKVKGKYNIYASICEVSASELSPLH